MTRAPNWTDAELAILREHYPAHGSPFVAQLLGRAPREVQRVASRHGVAKSGWSDEHVAILRRHYPTKGAAYVAKLVGRNAPMVSTKASTLGIRCETTVRGGKVYNFRLKSGPAAVIVPLRRGPAHLDGPLIFTDQTRRVVCPSMPQPTRSNTHSMT